MAAEFLERHAPVAKRIEQVSGIRPVTLLVAFGIVLITVILISTGIAANHLRQQALETTESELGRIDNVLVEATRRTLGATDSRLAEIAERLGPAATGGTAALRDDAATPEIAALLRGTLGRSPRIDAIAIVAADGTMLSSEGKWPAGNIEWRQLIAPMLTPGRSVYMVGTSIPGTLADSLAIPLAHRIDGPQGTPAGAVIALIPGAEFAALFAAVPIAEDAAIMLLRQDGTILTSYPASSGLAASPAELANLDVVFGNVNTTMVRHVTDNNGDWRIEAVRAVADYPVAVMVGRGADRALAGWAHQGMWFGVFSLAGAIGIGIMVYLIAHQFENYATIATIRSENIEVERARLAAEAELLKAERLSVLGQLTATVAHELRNPLSAIRNTLFTVKELTDKSGIKLDRPIARMERSIERCDRIISDLLEYTRTRELKRTAVGFDRWISDVLGEQTIPPPVKLVKELGAGEAQVPIDADRVRRVVINLVENAAQALGELPAERNKQIMVRTTTDRRELVLTIEDTGPGVPPENLARIFEPLFSTKSFGTGLGLPTVKQIVNQHGGIITIDSEVGQGTCVTVRLPLETETVDGVKVAA